MKKIRSTAKPYEDDKPYIFVSYSHKDSPHVYPIIEQLARDGYRIWYDEGISPGSDWVEVIADHMNRSSFCMAFISENAAASHNCRREINFALSKNKPLLSVFLETTKLTPGMEMSLYSNQCVFKYEYTDIEKFFNVIISAPMLKPCLGEPRPDIEVRSYGDEEVSEPIRPVFVLVRQSTREMVSLDGGDLSVGRKADNVQSSYVIPNNDEVSRKHFIISKQSGDYYISDCKSKNKTFHNGSELQPFKPVKLNEGDEIRISTGIRAEYFVFQTKPTGGDRLP